MFSALFGGRASARLAAISSSTAMIEFALDGTIVSANENFLKVMGYTAEDVIGKHHSLFVDPVYRDSDDYRQFWAKLRRGEFLASEFKRISKSGKDVWLEASYNPIFRGNKPSGVIKIATDISQKKEEAVELRGKIEAIGRSQAVIEFAMDGTVISANKNFLSVMGYGLDAVSYTHLTLPTKRIV